MNSYKILPYKSSGATIYTALKAIPTRFYTGYVWINTSVSQYEKTMFAFEIIRSSSCVVFKSSRTVTNIKFFIQETIKQYIIFKTIQNEIVKNPFCPHTLLLT